MIQVTSAGLQVSVSGAVVYLDNWAVIELAKKDPSRRSRFIDIVHSGIDVLFSVTNAAELSGPQADDQTLSNYSWMRLGRGGSPRGLT